MREIIKALKDIEPKTGLWQKIYLSDWFDVIYRPYCRVWHFCSTIKKMFIYFPLIWRDQDWDADFLYEMMEFKMERMLKALKEGSAEHDKDTLQALRICARIMHRLSHRWEYHDRIWARHDEKWGNIKSRFGPSREDGLRQWIVERENVKTPEDEEQERKDMFECIEMEEKIVSRDLKIFGKLFAKYSRSWWD